MFWWHKPFQTNYLDAKQLLVLEIDWRRPVRPSRSCCCLQLSESDGGQSTTFNARRVGSFRLTWSPKCSKLSSPASYPDLGEINKPWKWYPIDYTQADSVQTAKKSCPVIRPDGPSRISHHGSEERPVHLVYKCLRSASMFPQFSADWCVLHQTTKTSLQRAQLRTTDFSMTLWWWHSSGGRIGFRSSIRNWCFVQK